MAIEDLLKEEPKNEMIKFTVTFYPNRSEKDKNNVDKINKIIEGLQKKLEDAGSKKKISETDVIRELLSEALEAYDV